MPFDLERKQLAVSKSPENPSTPFDRMANERREQALAEADDVEFEEIVDEMGEEDFYANLETLEGVIKMLQYVESLSKDPESVLFEDLDVDSVDWPEEGKLKIRTFRLEYKDLLSSLKEAASQEQLTSELSDSLAFAYERFGQAQTEFDSFQDKYLNTEEMAEEKTEEKSSSTTEEYLENKTEDFTNYKKEIRQELVSFLRDRGDSEEELEARLVKSIDKSESPEELARIRHNILNDPYWKQKEEREARFEKFNNKESVKKLFADIDEEINDIRSTRDIFYARFPRKGRTDKTIKLLNNIAGFVAKAEDLKEKAESNNEQDPAVLKSALEKYLRLIEKTGKELEQFIESLTDEEAGMPGLREVVESKEPIFEEGVSEVVEKEEIKPFVVTQDYRVRESAESLPEDLEEGSPEVPSEVIVSSVVEDLNTNLFIAEEERNTANAMYEAFEKSLALGEDADRVALKFKNFKEFVDNLKSKPSEDYLKERVDRIIERVEAGTSIDSDFRMTVDSMRENFDRVSSAEDATEKNIIRSYRVIEDHVTQHEDLWLSVCGMRIPKPGPGGVFGARSFREGLKLVKDSHEDLQSPEKRVVVNQMISLLETVPNDGLSDEQATQLTRLAKLLDVPSSVVGKLHRSEKNKDEERPEEEEASDIEIPVFKTKRNVSLNITADSEPEEYSSIEIKVADGAEEKVEGVDGTTTEAHLGEVIPDSGRDTESAWERIEDHDPINKAVPAPELSIDSDEVDVEEVDAGSINHQSLPRYEKTAKAIFIERLLTPSQLDVMAVKYEKTEDFVRFVNSNIREIDKKNFSKLNSLFGEKPSETFQKLKDFSVEQILAIDSLNYAEKVAELQQVGEDGQKGVKYEDFRSWADEVQEMIRFLPLEGDEKLEEAFVMWMAFQELGE